MKFFNFSLICFTIIATLFLNENIFCKKTINSKNEKASKNQKNKMIYRLLSNKSVIITKHKNMNLNVYSMLGRFGK
jgi:hypothetical protein